MGNHKTIRAVQGCSGRAGSQNPGSNCALHPGAPGSSRTGRRGARTGTATTEDRAGDRGGNGGWKRMTEPVLPTAAGRRPQTPPPTARAPHPLPSRIHHAVLTTLKRKEKPLRRRPPLSSHPHGPHWRHGSREAAAAADSKIRPLSPRAMVIGALGQHPRYRLEPRGQC